MEPFHLGTDAVLGLLILALGWMVRTSIVSNNKKHEAHFKHANNRAIHDSAEDRNTRIIAFTKNLDDRFDAHERLDDERFKAVDEIRLDVKDILKILGSRK